MITDNTFKKWSIIGAALAIIGLFVPIYKHYFGSFTMIELLEAIEGQEEANYILFCVIFTVLIAVFDILILMSGNMEIPCILCSAINCLLLIIAFSENSDSLSAGFYLIFFGNIISAICLIISLYGNRKGSDDDNDNENVFAEEPKYDEECSDDTVIIAQEESYEDFLNNIKKCSIDELELILKDQRELYNESEIKVIERMLMLKKQQ